MSTTLITTELGHRYPGADADVFASLNLRFERQEFVVVRGASGSGKTTLLSILGGLLQPSAGQVQIHSLDPYAMSAAARAKFRGEQIGFVFQTMHLLPFLNVMQNALLAAAETSPTKARDLLEHYGLGHRLQHRPAQLSVGERQRVALVRALMQQPKLLLADEPTGNLDPDNSRRVLAGLQEFQQQGGTVILATHAAAADLEGLKPTQQLSLAS